jgi:hypothetical protein
MRRLSQIIAEDTNQFGPGTDLMVSLLAVLLVMTFITAYLYRVETLRISALQVALDREKERSEELAVRLHELDARGGNFRLAADSFSAADFRAYPVTELVDRASTARRVQAIVEQYRQLRDQYPHIFVIGHSNTIDDPRARDTSVTARRQRNWIYAAKRATLIAGLMQDGLGDDVERIVVVTTGELDLKLPGQPQSQENAWVEVVFGREWSIPKTNGG